MPRPAIRMPRPVMIPPHPMFPFAIVARPKPVRSRASISVPLTNHFGATRLNINFDLDKNKLSIDSDIYQSSKIYRQWELANVLKKESGRYFYKPLMDDNYTEIGSKSETLKQLIRVYGSPAQLDVIKRNKSSIKHWIREKWFKRDTDKREWKYLKEEKWITIKDHELQDGIDIVKNLHKESS